MKKLIPALLVTFTLAWLPHADAQLFSRKPKAPPEQRVGELIVQAKTDKDDHKRAAAAEELREFDTKLYTEVVPVLVDIARTDPKANVRGEALASLAKIRPVSPNAGQALEWAAAHDESWKVRMQAKTALMRYGWAGYQAGKGDAKDPQAAHTAEPPTIDPRNSPQAKSHPATPAPTTTVRTPAKTGWTPVNTPRNNATPPPVIVTQPAPSAPQAVPSVPQIVTAPTPPPVIVTQPAPSSPQAVPSAPQAVPSVPPIVTAPTPPPVIVTQPALTKPTETPPIVNQPVPVNVPLPPIKNVVNTPAPLPEIVLPPLPTEPTPAVKAPLPAVPAAPVATPRSDVTEPNFRPAGQTPPRFTTAVPTTPTPAPTGPVLRPPM